MTTMSSAKGDSPASLMTKYRELVELAGTLDIADLAIEERAGKLHVSGKAMYEMEKNLVWDKIKSHAGWENEVSADLSFRNTDAYGVYTVQKGDTLSAIAKRLLDSPNRYKEIFEANRGTLSDPDKIQVGQKLTIPRK